MKYKCPCCGWFTYPVPPKDDVGYICPVCFWENDPFAETEEEPSDSNHGVSLNEARENFREFGACVRRMLPYVRAPREDELSENGGEISAYPVDKKE